MASRTSARRTERPAVDMRPVPSSEDLGLLEGAHTWLQRAHIQAVMEARANADRACAEAEGSVRAVVEVARVAGLTWADVALALAVSRQSAWQRYGPV